MGFDFSSCFCCMEIEGSVIHIMKALASHQCAAPSLIEDDALQVLFHMVANGSVTVFSQFRDGIVPLHTIQLHRHAMQVIWDEIPSCFEGSCFCCITVPKYVLFITEQVLGLLLANDNGTSAKYIRKHQLVHYLFVLYCQGMLSCSWV